MVAGRAQGHGHVVGQAGHPIPGFFHRSATRRHVDMRASRKFLYAHATRAPMSRRQALAFTLAGVLSGLGAGRLRADSIPSTQVPTAVKPSSVTLFTATGSGAKDGSDWRDAMPLDALPK